MIGQQIDKYHILEQLGEGGMAQVYLAMDMQLKRNVAIKILRAAIQNNEKSVKRFELEAQALARLKHPNIVQVIDYGDYEGNPYLVMEHVAGGNLKQKLNKPIHWQEAARILAPIASALADAHKNNIIHRDVKPANILLRDDGTPLLTDFGIAKILEMEETLDLTGTSMGVGTPYYMAPEQSQSGAVSPKLDIYALGVVFYEMVTGRKPYQADTPMAVMLMHMQDPIPRPRKFNKDVSSNVERVLFKALAKDPAQRWNTMDEFSAVLTDLGAGRKVSVKRRVSRRVLAGVGVISLLMAGWLFRQQWMPIFSISDGLLSETPTSLDLEALINTDVPLLATIDSATVTPDATSKPRPTTTATELFVVSNKVYSEERYDFDDAEYDGQINSLEWNKLGDCSNVWQEEGLVVFNNQNDSCDLYLNSVDIDRFRDVEIIKFRIKIEEKTSEVVTQEVVIQSESRLGFPGWYLFFGLYSQGNRVSAFCDLGYELTEGNRRDEREEISVNYNAWYDFEVHFDHEVGEIECFVEERLLASITPSHFFDMMNAKIDILVESARPTGGNVLGYTDYIYINPGLELPENTLFVDQFDDSALDDTYDAIKWNQYAFIDSSYVTIGQENGVLLGTVNKFSGNKDAGLQTNMQWDLSEIAYFETKFQFDDYVSANWLASAFGFVNSSNFHLLCDFKIHSSAGSLGCVTYDYSETEDVFDGIQISPDIWYTLRIDLAQYPDQFDFYLNDTLIASYKITDPTRWEDILTRVYLNIGTTNLNETAHVQYDYVIVVGK